MARSVGEIGVGSTATSDDDDDKVAEATAQAAHDGSAIGRCSATREFLREWLKAASRHSRTAVVCGASAIETISQRKSRVKSTSTSSESWILQSLDRCDASPGVECLARDETAEEKSSFDASSEYNRGGCQDVAAKFIKDADDVELLEPTANLLEEAAFRKVENKERASGAAEAAPRAAQNSWKAKRPFERPPSKRAKSAKSVRQTRGGSKIICETRDAFIGCCAAGIVKGDDATGNE